MSKRILIIKACGVKGEDHECSNIKTQAELYNIETQLIEPNTIEELSASLSENKSFDYIYLSSHGDADGLCNNTQSISLTWFEFGVMLCETGCMNENCILMLSCCRGGLNQVAFDLFYCCDKISYIVGPRQSLPASDMLISFNLLLYNITFRGLDPIVACEKIKAGTDIRFVCFDKLEVETEPSYIWHIQGYLEQQKKQLEEAKRNLDEAPLEGMSVGNIVHG